MNDLRRKELKNIVKQANKLATLLDEMINDLENIRDEEQGSFDNMPMSLQDSDRGQTSQDAITELENALSMLQDLDCETLIGSIDTAAE